MEKTVDNKENNKNNNSNLISTSFEKNKGPLFKIFYDFDKHVYYMMDLGVGYGTFYKIEDDVIIKSSRLHILRI